MKHDRNQQLLRKDSGSITGHLGPTDQPTDRRGHVEVTLPMNVSEGPVHRTPCRHRSGGGSACASAAPWHPEN